MADFPHIPFLRSVDFLRVFSDIPEGVIITDAEGIVVFRNRAQETIDKLDSEKAVGMPITSLYGQNEKNSMVMRCLKSGQSIHNQVFHYRTPQGPLRKAVHSVYPLRDKESLQGAICFVWDSEVLQKQIAGSSALVREDQRNLGNGTRFTFPDIIGADPAFLRLVEKAKSVASSPSPVMLSGDTGTGKELFAQAIHNHSPRRDRPFVAVNCAAIPDSLQESILFGTVRGAFTGSVDKAGLFEEARGGTIYFDELDCMPFGLQAKLLRVLQERRIRRLGSSHEIDVDIKILSSVSREPMLSIEEGSLRKDLFYRLGTLIIRLPLLKDRRMDIPTLAEYFIAKINYEQGRDVRGLSDEVLSLFLAYDWPGNVRQLEHVIEAAMHVACGGERIEREDLEGELFPAMGAGSTEGSASPREAPQKEAYVDVSEGLQAFRARKERDMILSVLQETCGRVSQAARKLGVSRQLLHYKLRRMGVDPHSFRKHPEPPAGER